MAFDAEDPHEIGKSGSGKVDRSQGAAKAITVSRSRVQHPKCHLTS
jgi:hypothetical protein